MKPGLTDRKSETGPYGISYGPEFFSGFISTTSSVVLITARITSIFVSSTAVLVYDFHIFTVIIKILLSHFDLINFFCGN